MTIYYDPYDYEIDVDPHRVWRRIREEQPLYRNERYGFWALSRFDDVWSAYHDTVTFSSSHGVQLETLDEPIEHPSMIFMDPPEHDRLRKLVSRAFTPRRVHDIEAFVATLADDYLEQFAGAEQFDYVEQFGALVPPMVIGELRLADSRCRAQIGHQCALRGHARPDVMTCLRTSRTPRLTHFFPPSIFGFQGYNYFGGHAVHGRKRMADQQFMKALDASSELELTVVGRTSGREISIPVWFVRKSETLYLVPGNGSESDWYKNMRKRPTKRRRQVARSRNQSSPDQRQRGTSRSGCSSSSVAACEFCMATWDPKLTCERTASRKSASSGIPTSSSAAVYSSTNRCR